LAHFGVLGLLASVFWFACFSLCSLLDLFHRLCWSRWSGGGGMIHIIFYAERSDALGWNIVNSLLFAVFSFYCCRAPIDDQSDVVRLFKRTGSVCVF
jgi:hypothetical protein